MFKHPLEVTCVVGGEVKFGARFQDSAEFSEKLVLDEPTFMMSLLWPGIRIEQMKGFEGGVGRAFPKELARLAFRNADILQAPLRTPFGDGFQVGARVFQTDETTMGILCRALQQKSPFPTSDFDLDGAFLAEQPLPIERQIEVLGIEDRSGRKAVSGAFGRA